MKSFKLEKSVGGEKKQIMGALIVVVIAVCGYLIFTSSPKTPSVSSTPVVAQTVSAEPELELLQSDCNFDGYGYAKFTGQIKNISDTPLRDVEAVASAYTADGTFINAEDALIEYNPVMPGQTSPYEVTMTENPLMKKCKVDFKELMGGTILTKKSDK